MSTITDSHIIEVLKQGNLVIFVGAGLSVGAGLPSWSGLFRPLAQSIGYKLPPTDELLTTDHLLATAQYYANEHGLNHLIQYLRTQLSTIDIEPTSTHYLLASLPINTIFTTNYDDLIERALRGAGKRHQVVVSSMELAYWNEQEMQLVKLCGDLTRPESVVITKSQFNTYFTTHSRLAERLRMILESKAVLFLGYSLSDPFFNQVWDMIGSDFGQHRQVGYAVFFDLSPLDEQDLIMRGIRVVNLSSPSTSDKTSLLTEWLRRIVAGVAQIDINAVKTSSTVIGLQTIHEQLSRMESKQDDQNIHLVELKRGQAFIYQHVSQTNQETVQIILKTIQKGQMDQVVIERAIEAIRQGVKELIQHGRLLDQQILEVVTQAESIVESDLEVRHKLEATIPLIPFFLDYKVEFGPGTRFDIDMLWNELKKNFG